jgi:hypothetical protein
LQPSWQRILGKKVAICNEKRGRDAFETLSPPKGPGVSPKTVFGQAIGISGFEVIQPARLKVQFEPLDQPGKPVIGECLERDGFPRQLEDPGQFRGEGTSPQ